MTGVPSFTWRQQRRQAEWWDAGIRRRGLAGAASSWHRARERRVSRTRDEPDTAWRCCRYWPRTLVDKLNGREFAARHGCPLPQLYWYGTDLDHVVWGGLPDTFVLKPRFGAATKGVMAVRAGRDVLRDTPADLRRRPSESRLRRALGRCDPTLIEEFAVTEGYDLPMEYKCHTFGSQVHVIELVERTAATRSNHRFYTPGWEVIDDPFWSLDRIDPMVRDAPAFLDELIATAGRIGAAIGTYMRIDFFASGAGFVFNEFSSVPNAAGNVTPYADSLFGAAWQSACPEQL